MRGLLVLLVVLAVGVGVGVVARPQPSGGGAEAEVLLRAERAEVARLEGVRAGLRGDADRLGAAAARRRAALVQATASADALAPAAGLVAVAGPGVEVVLDDAPSPGPPGATPDDLVVHSQDVRAVVNALWRAGAGAVAVNGQRVVVTSALRCVGTTLLINGTRQPPPYVATAVGASAPAVAGDPLVGNLRRWADRVGLRLDLRAADHLTVPPYDGPLPGPVAAPA